MTTVYPREEEKPTGPPTYGKYIYSLTIYLYIKDEFLLILRASNLLSTSSTNTKFI
jgi:hypothetical protein